jgi:PAS domain S-box-containing protein
MLGRSESELLTLTIGDITHPEDLFPNLDSLDKLLRNELSGYRLEKRYLRANGSYFWGDLTVAAQRDDTGSPIKLISVIVDVTAKKNNEERLEFIMGELAHRTKNMAAVIQSVINQSVSSATSVAEFQRHLTDRLSSIIASQSALSHNEGSSAMLHDLARQQLDVFGASSDPRIHLRGPALALNQDATRVIGMVLHELTTNALKYGALSTIDGNVTVAWEIDDAGMLSISWIEQDGPEVSPPQSVGVGRKVIERMVQLSTNGQVELRFDPQGVSWRLTAPATQLLD